MPSFAGALSSARAAAMLTLQEFATLVGYPVDQVRIWEAGTVPSGEEIERCALVFGVGVADFLAGEAATANMTLLFKRNREPQEAKAHAQLFDLEGTTLGPNRFCRAVADLARLGRILGRPRSVLPQPVPTLPPGGANPGDPMAQAAREALGLDPKEPIASMRQLLDARGVEIVVAGTDEVDRRINGASTSTPLSAILIARGANEPWVLRMTLAHELAHLLYHKGTFTLSPGPSTTREAWVLETGFMTREQEADAFAAAFLAPRFAVQDLLQQERLAPESSAAIRAVGAHFGVGKEVAVNRIVDSMGLTDLARTRMRSVPVRWTRAFEADSFGEDEVGIQAGTLRARVEEAVQRGLISELAGRSILSIPYGLTLEGAAEPVDSTPKRVARRMQHLLERQRWAGIPVDVENAAGGWAARLVDMQGMELGRVLLDADEQTLRRLDS